MTTNLSTRALKAIEVLKQNGRFVDRLELNSYTRREQFAKRLLDKQGYRVTGFGLTIFYELYHAGMLKISDSSTTTCTIYKLKEA